MKTKHILMTVTLLLATGMHGQSASPQGAVATRNLSRGASTDIDASYYNPAGTVMLSEGFHISVSNQSVFQKRIIESTYTGYIGSNSENGSDYKKFEGKSTRLILPSIQGVYKKDKWALSGSLTFTGDGKVTFKNGLSMFEAPISTLPVVLNQVVAGGLIPLPTSTRLNVKGYSIDQHMAISNSAIEGQIGGAYKINEMFSVYGGFKLNVVRNKYKGHLKNLELGITSENLGAIGIPNNDGNLTNPTAILSLVNNMPLPESIKRQFELPILMANEGAYLESKQAGWGVAPVLGVHFSYEGLNVGAKYTFRAKIALENTTRQDDFGLFADGEMVRDDIPALFSLGASYQFTPKLNGSISYLHLFQSSAKKVANKNEFISGSNEFALGTEYTINTRFLVSLSGALAKHDVKKEYQSDLDFLLGSYSIGLGGAMNITEKLQTNIGFSWTHYSKDRVSFENNPSDEYAKKSKSFSVGLSYSFQ